MLQLRKGGERSVTTERPMKHPGEKSVGWALVHAVGPALAAAFATSPAPGFASERLTTWLAIDHSRTSSALRTGDLLVDWATFALDARMMLLRLDGDRCEPMGHDLTLARWIERGWLTGVEMPSGEVRFREREVDELRKRIYAE